MDTSYATFISLVNNALAGMIAYIPQLAAALVIFVVGWILAKVIKGSVLKILKTVFDSKVVKKAPISDFFKRGELDHKIEDLIASVIFWIIMLVVIHSTVAVLGLSSLSHLLEQIINYIPNIIAAFIVFIFGVVLAGLVESLVKSAVRSIDGRDNKSALVAGKLAGYFVFSITGLVAVSELGIAREFILILFIGFVLMFSLGFALAIGLGAKDLIQEMLHDWYHQIREEE